VKVLKELDVAGSATLNGTGKDFFIQWHLTERCNLACRHCYQSGGKSSEMDFDEIRETAGEAADMLQDWAERYGIVFSPSLNITGGEPFLRTDLLDIITLLVERGFEIYLLTNGTLIDRGKAKRLKGLVHGVQVSIEGPEAVHDSIRGAGTFRKAIAGVEALSTHDVPVSLNVTASRLNAPYLSAVAALGRELGVRSVGFSRLVPQGRGAAMTGLLLDSDQVQNMYRTLFSLGNGRTKIVSGDPLSAFLDAGQEEDAGDIAIGGCAAGISGLTILPDGAVTPCRRLPIPIGNVHEDSLRQIWAESRVLNLLRDRNAYSGKCGVCRRWAVCRGCRAIAFGASLSKDRDAFLDDDPQCFASDCPDLAEPA